MVTGDLQGNEPSCISKFMKSISILKISILSLHRYNSWCETRMRFFMIIISNIRVLSHQFGGKYAIKSYLTKRGGGHNCVLTVGRCQTWGSQIQSQNQMFTIKLQKGDRFWKLESLCLQFLMSICFLFFIERKLYLETTNQRRKAYLTSWEFHQNNTHLN